MEQFNLEECNKNPNSINSSQMARAAKSNEAKPKFKVGDIIRSKKNKEHQMRITGLGNYWYLFERNEFGFSGLKYEHQDDWELVEDKPDEWSEDDSRILNNVKAFIGYAAGQRGVKDELFREANEWLNSFPIGFVHNENYNEDMVTLLIDELKQIANRNNAPEQYKMEIDWLKSLRPQLKQEWSEDDEKMLVSFLHKVEVCDLLSNKEIAWIRKKLKSVKPPFHWKPSEVKNETKNECPNYSEGYGCSTSPLKQCDTCPDYKLYNHWKPSKEQMEIVENLLACEMPPRHKKIFESLYNDLKNLRS